MTGYYFDQTWERERHRLDALGVAADPFTFAQLERLGVAPGWRCLEVGAGSGTVARWLAARVEPDGRVVATDIDPRFLERAGNAGLEVRRHDITRDELETGAYDLVHARFVLQHLPEREAALSRMAAALRPGGRLVVEDLISPVATCDPPIAAYGKILAALDRGLRQAGADPDYGLKLPAALSRLGLVDVDCAASVSILRSGTAAIEFIPLSLEHVAARLIEVGAVTSDELTATIAAMRTPGHTVVPATTIAAWGTAPAGSS